MKNRLSVDTVDKTLYYMLVHSIRSQLHVEAVDRAYRTLGHLMKTRLPVDTVDSPVGVLSLARRSERK